MGPMMFNYVYFRTEPQKCFKNPVRNRGDKFLEELKTREVRRGQEDQGGHRRRSIMMVKDGVPRGAGENRYVPSNLKQREVPSTLLKPPETT